ncbi:MAG TPA: GNAT family N-acetyltransferase [Polyangia bacterium]|jgi:L-amino acid N-acyltransferase YncA
MDGYPKTVRARGLELTIRPLEPNDLDDLARFFRELPESERMFLRENVTDLAVVKRFVAELGDDHTLRLVAITDGRIVAHGALLRERPGWMRHVGEVRVIVAKEAQRRGVATVLVRELCSQAVARGIDKLVAMVPQDQTGALATFEKLGFSREATLRNHVLDLKGQKRDLLVLANHTAELWHRMEDMILDREFSVEQ